MTLPPESADKTACGSAAINEAGSFPEGGYAGIDTREYWKNWKWQVRHAIRSIDTVQQVLGITFDPEERSQLQKTVDKFPLCITPYYLSLIDTEDYRNDPIFRQAFPSPAELIVENYELSDPLSEDKDSPCECITHRYPDRVLFLISNTCAMYCRHCTRKRKVGDLDSIPDREKIQEGIAYIRENSHIRDVLLSGGDPLMLSDEVLDWILTELSAIPHVEVIRIGTRVPVVLPFRITDELVRMLKKHHPIWINTQFNHPKEMTNSAQSAIAKLADAGIPLGNQSVLLARINDCPIIMKELVHQLVKNRIRPYYLYQCDLSEGISHFRTPISKGIEIMESLTGHTSGFAVPRYVVDAPGGGGKIPVSPNYLLTWSVNKVVLRNYEGIICTYQEPAHYDRILCDENCDACKLQLDIEHADESKVVGVARLLADYDETTTLIPENNERIERRDDESL
ncbi:MAG: lysine 2,3-aminomutase [Methanocorpusculum sp.]|uniref:lysine 2,3-aminomutase n=1 Tax=Methanocorpusculum sp. GPch4 TaxID=2527877 RepID=UPI0014332BFF|nr:lysine 2,3-aminomutase [Methanocorpusculum sp. GPch4]MDD2803432.1 lysine 2,3-aminomutase [Methanocorpusculum sp.]MDD3047195.1 lysine 2,3-aminomutase [Methanocorpusculum sp.]MDD4423767.1 lysine 2,3-aminomutase [Methanocorpusculum parvum]